MTLDPRDDPQDRAYKPKLEVVESEPATPASPVEEFVDRLYDLTPRAYLTTTLIVVNVLVFLAMAATGVSVTRPTVPDLLQWGANYGLLTTHGEWWRLLTATFVHIGILHLAFNMLALYQIGGIVERLLGNLGFAFVYVASGLIASLTSLCWDPFVTSAGASGAVFGVFGALLGCHLRARRVIPSELFRGMLSGLLPFLGYNLLYGLIAKNVDQAAHLGGFVAGFALGLALGHPRTLFDRQGRTWRTVVTAAIVAPILLVWILAMRGWVADPAVAMSRVASIEKTVLARYRRATEDRDAKKITDEQLAAILEKEIIPPWQDGLAQLAALKRLPKPMQKNVQAVSKVMSLLLEGWELKAAGLRERDKAKVARADARLTEAEALIRERNTSNAPTVKQPPR